MATAGESDLSDMSDESIEMMLGDDFGHGVAGDVQLGAQGEDIRADVRDNARRDAREANAPVDIPGGRPE